MTAEEELIQCYFDAFNNHDIEGVMACFHEYPVMVDATGTRFEGREEVRRHYETGFALMPDCRCDLRMLTGHSGHGVAESYFRGTRPRYGKVIEAIGAEILEIEDGRIKEMRDYHRPLSASGIANIYRSSAQGDSACNPKLPLTNLRNASRALRDTRRPDNYCQSSSSRKCRREPAEGAS